MAKAKKKRRSAVGTALYVLVLVLWILALSAGALYILKQVWDYADVYDETQPEPVLNAYLASLRENLWDDSIAAELAAMPHQVQSDEEVASLVKQMLTEGEIWALLDSSKTRSDRRTYALICGEDNIFGEVVLEEDTTRNLVANVDIPSQVVGVLARIGVAIQPELYPWKVAEESFDFSGLYSSVRVTVPESYRVSLNNVFLSDEYIVERDIHYDVLEHYYWRYDNLPCKVTYQFDHIMGHIDPVVYDENGNVFVIDENKDDSQFLQPVDPQVLSVLEGFINEFADAYLHYSAGTMDPYAGYNLLLPYIERGSEFDEKMKQALDIGDWRHNSNYQYKGSGVTNAVKLGENFFVVEFYAGATVQQPAGLMDVTRNFRAIVDGSKGTLVVATIDDI